MNVANAIMRIKFTQRGVKTVTVLLLLTANIFFPVYLLASPETISISKLLAHSTEFDQQEVVFKGEAIGDLMIRGEDGWVNISDGKSAIGVFGPAALLEQINLLGGYHTRGDMVKITGIFHHHCPKHHGGTHVSARKIEVLQEGFIQEEELSPLKLYLSILLALLAMLSLLVRQIFRREPLRKADSGRPRSP